jgi:hypothetical protein
MSDEEEIKKIEEEAENLTKVKEQVKESFSHMPDIQSKILGISMLTRSCCLSL